MRPIAAAAAALFALCACAPKPPPPPGAALAAGAYPQGAAPPDYPLKHGVYRMAGSTQAFPAERFFDDANPPDWNPEQHPAPPAIVAHGKPPLGRADGPTPCGACHRMDGQGFIGTPNLAGLPAAYIVQQVEEFRAGRRQSWQHGRGAVREMVTVATKVTDAETASAAAYFAAIPMRPWVRVVETDTVPATQANAFGWLDLVPGKPAEPIRGRIIEVAQDMTRAVLLDPNAGNVAYAPKGAVARGAALARTGGPAGAPCAACHGPGLKGAGEIPSLAGRSPAYLARALWDIKMGARTGPAVAPMQPTAARLSEADVTDLAAYLASLRP